MIPLGQEPTQNTKSFEFMHSKVVHNKNPITAADIMRNDVSDQPSSTLSTSQISEVPTSKEQPFEITHSMVGHKKNTQVDAGEMHKDSMAEKSTPALKMPEKVPMHEIDCVINGCNLGPVGQIWKSNQKNLKN